MHNNAISQSSFPKNKSSIRPMKLQPGIIAMDLTTPFSVTIHTGRPHGIDAKIMKGIAVISRQGAPERCGNTRNGSESTGRTASWSATTGRRSSSDTEETVLEHFSRKTSPPKRSGWSRRRPFLPYLRRRHNPRFKRKDTPTATGSFRLKPVVPADYEELLRRGAYVCNPRPISSPWKPNSR